jgi:hypothetical protein
MKKIIVTLGLILSSAVYAQGTADAIEAYLQTEFSSINSIGSFYFLGSSQNCDEKVSVYVTGNMGSGTTAYDCEVCLYNDGGYTMVDSEYSECYRQGN